MCECNPKPERPKKPSPVLWEEEVAKRTEGKLPPGYHTEHHRFGDDDRTGLVTALDTRNKRAVTMNHGDYRDSSASGFALYREVTNSLVKKAWKNFLKKGY